MMIKREKLSLTHNEILHDTLRSVPAALSEYSFANLFLFREKHNYEVLFIFDELFISGTTYDGFKFLMPTRKPEKKSISLLNQLMHDYDGVFPVPGGWLSIFDEKAFSYACDERDSDYIYTVEKMETFSGRKLHKKRNLLKQFLTLYTPDAVPLTRQNKNDASIILDVWQEDTELSAEDTDYKACKEALYLYEDLSLCGSIYYVDGEPGGFMIGEELTPDTFVCHFAKGIKKYKGLYQYMYNNFAQVLPSQYTYLNLEQDLGNLALRIAKASYQPEKMEKKYRLVMKT